MVIELRAEFEASVNELLYPEGSHVTAGDCVLMLDVCKMLQPIHAPDSGNIAYTVRLGDYVKEGDLLARIE